MQYNILDLGTLHGLLNFESQKNTSFRQSSINVSDYNFWKMTHNTKTLNAAIQAILTVLLGLIILLAGCGPSYEERQAQKEAERKEKLRKKQHKIAEVERRFNAVYFPPQEIKATSFTYEIQKFFEVHTDDTIVFKGYLEDVEASENNVVVEFLCPIGEFYFLNKTAIRFRLTVPENNVDEFLEVKRSDPILYSLRYFDQPDHFVIANIMNLQKVHKYEFDGSANGEEVEIEAEVSRGLVATGQLIRAVPVPKKDKARP